MIQPILLHGDGVLHRPAVNVDGITPKIEALIDDMVETMYAAQGVGLAAPQVGVPLRIFVADPSVGRDPAELIIMVNPELIAFDGIQKKEEGCLSIPKFNAKVIRPARAVVRGLDRLGNARDIEGFGLLAQTFQHEMDHLEGKLFLDRLRGIEREMIVRKINKLKRRSKW